MCQVGSGMRDGAARTPWNAFFGGDAVQLWGMPETNVMMLVGRTPPWEVYQWIECWGSGGRRAKNALQ